MTANLSASVLTRLLSLSRKNGWDYQEVLVRYATERFLARIAASRWSDTFILKGGNMFVVWQGGFDYRPTMDTDFMWRGRGDSASVEKAILEIVETSLQEDDAIRFDIASLKVSPIRVQTRYGGIEATILAMIGRTRIPLHFDFGFGDRVWPAIRDERFPSLLAMESPRVRAYPKEATIAEKCRAMLEHGFENSRMKDFYDVWFLAKNYEFSFSDLETALRQTVGDIDFPSAGNVFAAFSDEFASHPLKLGQWSGFVKRSRLEGNAPTLAEACAEIREFLMPPLLKIQNLVKWSPGRGWLKNL